MILKLSDTRVYEPQIRALLGTAPHFTRIQKCGAVPVVLKLRTAPLGAALNLGILRVSRRGAQAVYKRTRSPRRSQRPSTQASSRSHPTGCPAAAPSNPSLLQLRVYPPGRVYRRDHAPSFQDPSLTPPSSFERMLIYHRDESANFVQKLSMLMSAPSDAAARLARTYFSSISHHRRSKTSAPPFLVSGLRSNR